MKIGHTVFTNDYPHLAIRFQHKKGVVQEIKKNDEGVERYLVCFTEFIHNAGDSAKLWVSEGMIY